MSVLERIFERKAEEVAEAKLVLSVADLKAIALDTEAPRGFQRAIAGGPSLALIAEIKKASPSKGVIREPFDPVEVAEAYERAGAHALSVLTDQHYFKGSPLNLQLAKRHTALPCLRKDFINDIYQVYQARAWGADAVLLIVAALTRSEICDLRGVIEELGMDALVEVHTDAEAQTAIDLKCPLIGVNNRDLSDFATSLSVSTRLLPAVVESGAVGVSESALETRGDLDEVEKAGAKAVLIGTTFCAAPDIEAKVREVMHW